MFGKRKCRIDACQSNKWQTMSSWARILEFDRTVSDLRLPVLKKKRNPFTEQFF